MLISASLHAFGSAAECTPCSFDALLACYGSLVSARSVQHERERSETLALERQLATRCSRLALLYRAANYNVRGGSRTHFKRVMRAACKNFSPCNERIKYGRIFVKPIKAWTKFSSKKFQ